MTSTPEPQPSADDLVDARTLAQMLGVAGSTLRHHVAARSPHLPAPTAMVGGAHVWRRGDLDLDAIKAAWPRRGPKPAKRD